MPNPSEYAVWSDEERALWDEIGPLILKLYLKGGENGLTMLPTEVQVLGNWEYFNRSATEYLRTYRLHTLVGINETTRKQTIENIDEWIQNGEPLDMLVKRLDPLFGPERAERIAVTEVTRVYAEGNLSSWRATGLVGGKRWNTAVDDLVCPICAPLDGMEVDMDEGFTVDFTALPHEVVFEMVEGEDGVYNWNGHFIKRVEKFGATYFEIGLDGPPAHPRCRCWLTPVVSEEMLREEIRGILQ